jgi:hypothetical protein
MSEDELTAWFGPRVLEPPAPPAADVIDGAIRPTLNRPRRKRDLANPTSNDIGKIGEAWAKETFAALIGCELRKNEQPRGAIYWKSTDLDFTARWRGIPTHIEVKTFTVDTAKLELSHISVRERAHFARALRDEDEGWLILCGVPAVLSNFGKSQVCAAWCIRWVDWLNVEVELLARERGRYRGRTWRLAQDAELIAAWQLTRIKRGWQIPAGHWLVR